LRGIFTGTESGLDISGGFSDAVGDGSAAAGRESAFRGKLIVGNLRNLALNRHFLPSILSLNSQRQLNDKSASVM
jgi:hypothetical protein